ncbi:hypothetical protein V1523DRAFT_190755 [Lipomyces doorenjongii]
MTVNHVFLMVSQSRMDILRAFYRTVLQPLGYTEMIHSHDRLIGYGSDYPYLWLKALPEDKAPMPTNIALDAKDPQAVDEFYHTALKVGGKDNGGPGIRPEMSRQPYYSAYIYDPDGNNIEAVYVKK